MAKNQIGVLIYFDRYLEKIENADLFIYVKLYK
jgi:hypothetical protein